MKPISEKFGWKELTVLNFGEVLAQGKTSDVLNDPKVITAYLGE